MYSKIARMVFVLYNSFLYTAAPLNEHTQFLYIGLFKRAILLSGSALSSWAVVDDPVSYALRLARAVNCSIPEDLLKDNELIVDCLRDRSLEELMLVDIQPPTFLSAFGPSVDGVVIKADFQKDLLSYMGPEFQGFG